MKNFVLSLALLSGLGLCNSGCVMAMEAQDEKTTDLMRLAAGGVVSPIATDISEFAAQNGCSAALEYITKADSRGMNALTYAKGDLNDYKQFQHGRYLAAFTMTAAAFFAALDRADLLSKEILDNLRHEKKCLKDILLKYTKEDETFDIQSNMSSENRNAVFTFLKSALAYAERNNLKSLKWFLAETIEEVFGKQFM